MLHHATAYLEKPINYDCGNFGHTGHVAVMETPDIIKFIKAYDVKNYH